MNKKLTFCSILIAHAKPYFLPATQVGRMFNFLVQGDKLYLQIGHCRQIIFNSNSA